MVTAAGEEVPPPSRTDGRTERTRRTRAAIVKAHLELMQEGDLRPSAQRLAERGGISVRTLWIHFPDMETLFAATAQKVLQEQARAHRPVPADLPLAVRVDRFCRQRARLLERLSPYARASQLREALSPVLQDYRARHVARVAEEVEQVFGPELPHDPAVRRELVHALTAACTWGSWSVLRQHLGLGVDRSRAVMTRTVAALLDEPAATDPPPADKESR